MNICLVRPPSVAGINSVGLHACPPIGPAYLAAILKKNGHTVTAVDAVGETLEQWRVVPDFPEAITQGLSISEIVNRIDSSSEVIGISGMFSNEWPFTKPFIAAIRDRFPEATIVMGGEHGNAVPEYCLNDCPELDYLILGEGEVPIVELLDALQDGTNHKMKH